MDCTLSQCDFPSSEFLVRQLQLVRFCLVLFGLFFTSPGQVPSNMLSPFFIYLYLIVLPALIYLTLPMPAWILIGTPR
jgi:hypothetical protein